MQEMRELVTSLFVVGGTDYVMKLLLVKKWVFYEIISRLQDASRKAMLFTRMVATIDSVQIKSLLRKIEKSAK